MTTPTTTTNVNNNTNNGGDLSAMMKKIEKELEEVYETEDGEEYCYQLSNEIIRLSSIMIEERHYERESILYTVDDCILKMFNILDYTFPQKDEGDAELFLMDHSPLEPSVEPDRIPNDSCARGSVPMRRKQPPPPSRPSSGGGRTSKSSIRSYLTNGSRLSTTLKPNNTSIGSTVSGASGSGNRAKGIHSSTLNTPSKQPILR